MRQRSKRRTNNDERRTRAALVLVAVCFIWGSTFIIVKQAVADISILLFLTLRFSIAAVLLALLFSMRKNRPPLRESLRGGIMAGSLLLPGQLVHPFRPRGSRAATLRLLTALL